ncbi:MAG: FAD-dependent oxidoreductase, partial [Clostridia bacterium]|nr:FAD-dependent oxidoreductase [Clostridia bacterium]
MTVEKAAGAKWSFEIAPEPVPEDKIVATYTHDIVVVGAGMAGLCTAVSAAEEGADVILFSASSKAMSRGGSNHAIGSRYQVEKGIEYSPELARRIVKI